MPTADPSPPNLEALLARYRRASDPAVLGRLFDAAAPGLFRLALSILRDPLLAEDALQDAFLDAFRHLDRHEAGRPVLPWLTGILQRSAYKVARTARRTPDRARYVSMRPRRAMANTDAEIAPLLESLDEPIRSAAILHWRYGLSPAEVAHVTGQPPGTVRSQLFRARERLRNRTPKTFALFALASPPRGLAAVRDQVVGQLTLTPAVAATSVLGVLTMGKKAWVATAVLITLAAGGAAWMAFDAGESAHHEKESVVTQGEGGGMPEPSRAPELTGATTATASGAELAGSVAPIRGLVVDHAGKAVAGARAYAIPGTLSDSLPARELTQHDGVAATETALDGSLALRVATDDVTHTIVVLSHDGTAAMHAGAKAGDDVRITLTAATRLAGHVMDPRGRAIAGASLTLRILLDALVIERAATSDADGRFALDRIPALSRESDAPWTAGLEVRHRAYAPVLLTRSRSAAQGEGLPLPSFASGATAVCDVVLCRGAVVRGVVHREDTEQTVAGARVALWSVEGVSDLHRPDATRVTSPFYGRIVTETTSGPDGAFVLHHVPASGFYRFDLNSGGALGSLFGHISVLKDGFVPGHHEMPVVPDGAALDITIRLWPGAVLEGRVLHADGTPARGVTAWAWAEKRHDQYALAPALAGEATSLGSTDEEGRFRLAGIRASARRAVEVELKLDLSLAFHGQSHRVVEHATRTLQVVAGDVKDLGDIVLSAPNAPAADVVVTTPAGEPIPGARVRGWNPHANVTADETGRARMWWPATWTQVLEEAQALRVSAPDRGTTYIAVTPSITSPPTVRVALALGKHLRGTVVDARGRGVPDALVHAYAASGTAVELMHGQRGTAANVPVTPELGGVVTGTDGTFDLGGLPEGPYRIAVLKLTGRASPKTKHLDVATARDDLRIALDVGAEELDVAVGATLEVRVVEAGTGTPITAADVHMRGRADRSGDRVRPGLLRVENVGDDTYTVRVMATGYLPQMHEGVRVVDGAPQVPMTFELSRGVVVRGRVTKRGGTPLNHTLYFTPERHGKVWSSVRATVGPDGRYEASGLVAGRYRVGSFTTARSNPDLPTLAPIDNVALVVPEGATTVDLDVTLEPAAMLVLKPHELQVAGEERPRLELIDARGTHIADVEVGKRGPPRWLMNAALAPGRYTVRGHLPDGLVLTKTLELKAGATHRVGTFK